MFFLFCSIVFSVDPIAPLGRMTKMVLCEQANGKKCIKFTRHTEQTTNPIEINMSQEPHWTVKLRIGTQHQFENTYSCAYLGYKLRQDRTDVSELRRVFPEIPEDEMKFP